MAPLLTDRQMRGHLGGGRGHGMVVARSCLPGSFGPSKIPGAGVEGHDSTASPLALTCCLFFFFLFFYLEIL